MARALTSEAEEAILESVKKGATLRHAAKANGYTDDQVNVWLKVARGELAYRVPGRNVSPWYAARIQEFMRKYEMLGSTVVTVVTEALHHEATTPDRFGRYNAWAAHTFLRHHPASRDDWKPTAQDSDTQRIVISAVYQHAKQLPTDKLLELAGEPQSEG